MSVNSSAKAILLIVFYQLQVVWHCHSFNFHFKAPGFPSVFWSVTWGAGRVRALQACVQDSAFQDSDL